MTTASTATLALASLTLALAPRLTAQETFASYDFLDNLVSTDTNPNVDATDMTANRAIMYWAGNGYTNLCIPTDWRAQGGYLEFTITPANGLDRLSVTELFVKYGGHGANGAVDRMKLRADEDPGAGGDNFQTTLYSTSSLGQDHTIDLSGVAFLQEVAGAITFRIEFYDTNGSGSSSHEIDLVRVKGNRTPPRSGNPCLGPQVYFDSSWTNSSYTVNGITPQWGFPHWSNDYDVACIDENGSTHIPAIWAHNCSIGCRKLEFKMKGRGSDDDSIGFVLGFCDGDQNDPDADYLAVIWNGTAQTAQFPNFCASVTKPRGMRLVRVFGIPDPAEFFGMTNLPCTPATSGVEVLATADTLGNSSWPADTVRSVRVEMEPNRLRIWVQGTLQFDRAGDYSPYYTGCFGYYAQSQFADFWGLVTTPINGTTAAWTNYGAGTPGCYGVPPLTMLGRPILNTEARIFMGNDGPAPAICGLFVSVAPDDLFIPLLGGNLLVQLPVIGVVGDSVPPGGKTFDCLLPDDSCMGGFSFYLQLLCIDPCGPTGIAMSRGLQLQMGDS